MSQIMIDITAHDICAVDAAYSQDVESAEEWLARHGLQRDDAIIVTDDGVDVPGGGWIPWPGARQAIVECTVVLSGAVEATGECRPKNGPGLTAWLSAEVLRALEPLAAEEHEEVVNEIARLVDEGGGTADVAVVRCLACGVAGEVLDCDACGVAGEFYSCCSSSGDESDILPDQYGVPLCGACNEARQDMMAALAGGLTPVYTPEGDIELDVGLLSGPPWSFELSVDLRALEDLDELCETLNAVSLVLRAWDDVADAPALDDVVDMTGLPTYGGPEPQDTTGVWSWDESRVLRDTSGLAADDAFVCEPREEDE